MNPGVQMMPRSSEDRRICDPDFALPFDRRFGKDSRRGQQPRVDSSDAALAISDPSWKMLFDLAKRYWRR